MNVFRKEGKIISAALYRYTYANIISVLMYVCMKSVLWPSNLKPLHYQCNLLFCAHNSFPQGGAYFSVEH